MELGVPVSPRAVLADIHGNLRALEAVRADIAGRSPDVIVNLGDHISGPLQAAATADFLMEQSYMLLLLRYAPPALLPRFDNAHTICRAEDENGPGRLA